MMQVEEDLFLFDFNEEILRVVNLENPKDTMRYGFNEDFFAIKMGRSTVKFY